MELWDLFDENGNALGKTHLRGEILEDGCFHYAVSISTFNQDNELLLTQRHPQKTWGLYWEITGGSVLATESVRQGALRELKEETGIELKNNQIIEFAEVKGENTFWVYYMAFTDLHDRQLKLQEQETIAARFVDEAALQKMMECGEIADPILERIHLTWDNMHPYFKEEADHLIPYQREYLPGLLDMCRTSILAIEDEIYSPREKQAWALGFEADERWHQRCSSQYTYLIENRHQIKAMISAKEDGEIDLLYVHPQFQHQGYASQLLQCAERQLKKEVTAAYASKKAKGFFEKMGYAVEKENHVIRNGVTLTNYLMTKKKVKRKKTDLNEEEK